MPITRTTALKAARHAQAAIRRGDLPAAERWLAAAEHAARLIWRFTELARQNGARCRAGQ
jgi:hypothetical protein